MNLLRIAAPLAVIFYLSGCAMMQGWKSIPPPGGCDQCHTVPISNNWTITYQAPNLIDERGHNYFQTEQYTMARNERPKSPLEQRKVEELRCFECHKSPDEAHKGRMGRFHH